MELFVGNLGETVSAADLARLFRDYKGATVRLVDKRFEDGRIERHAVASIDSDKLARKAIKQLDGQVLRGNRIVIREYLHRTYSNERRALNWRNQHWPGFERRQTERRQRAMAAPDAGLLPLADTTQAPAPAKSKTTEQTIKISGLSNFARKL